MNYKTMFKPSTRLFLSSLLLLGASFAATAGQDDFNLPIKVDASSQFVDGKNKTSIFRGDVNITQGTLVIDADEVEVDASLGEGREIFVARGEPASYSQQLDDGKRVIASAKEIIYQVDTRTISLAGDAQLVRDTSSVSGNSIIYDMTKEQLLAESNDSDGGRVTTVFRPETFDEVTKPESQEEKKPEEPPR